MGGSRPRENEQALPCVTIDYVVQWLREHPAECIDRRSYGIKHDVEQSTKADGRRDYLYCANNWVKYAMLELGWKARRGFTCPRGSGKRVTLPEPTLHGLKINSENWWPWIRKRTGMPVVFAWNPAGE